MVPKDRTYSFSLWLSCSSMRLWWAKGHHWLSEPWATWSLAPPLTPWLGPLGWGVSRAETGSRKAQLSSPMLTFACCPPQPAPGCAWRVWGLGGQPAAWRASPGAGPSLPLTADYVLFCRSCCALRSRVQWDEHPPQRVLWLDPQHLTVVPREENGGQGQRFLSRACELGIERRVQGQPIGCSQTQPGEYPTIR